MSTTETKTYTQFITENRLRMDVQWWHENPHMADSSQMDHWKCVIHGINRRMTVYFSKGIGHNGAEPPELDEVLDCLASDASGFENAQSFEDWCSEYGYDTDSRKAEKIYKTVERQADKLKQLLGHSYQELLFGGIERL